VALLAVGCGSDGHPYPDDVVENFVAACRTRVGEPTCRCAIGEIRRRFTHDEYAALESRIRQNEMPPELLGAIEGCHP